MNLQLQASEGRRVPLLIDKLFLIDRALAMAAFVLIALPVGVLAADPEPHSALGTNAATVLYLEHPESSRFVQLQEGDNHMRIRKGRTGKPCLVFELSWVTPGAGRQQFDRLAKDYSAWGYVERTPTAPIIEGSRAGQLFTDEIADDPRYASFFQIRSAEELKGQAQRLIHFPQGLDIDGDFDVEEISELNLSAGVIIEGDVRVKGVFSQLTYEYPGATLILGSVYARSFGHADSHMSIGGDLTVDNIIYGRYNDGSLHITGTASGRLWVSDDHDMSAGTYKIHQLEWGESDGLVEELARARAAEDDTFRDLILEYMYENRNPLRAP